MPLTAPLAYARRTLVNLHISQRRRRASLEVTFADPPDALATDAGDHGLQDDMWRMLAGLNERRRAVLVLRYHLDLSDREIAAVLGCRDGTVRSLPCAIAQLRLHPHLGPARGHES